MVVRKRFQGAVTSHWTPRSSLADPDEPVLIGPRASPIMSGALVDGPSSLQVSLDDHVAHAASLDGRISRAGQWPAPLPGASMSAVDSPTMPRETGFPTGGMELTHLLVVSDVKRSRDFYRGVLG